MHVQWWGYHEVVGTLKPYYMLKNLFELILLKDNRDGKTLGARARTRAHEPPGETFTTKYIFVVPPIQFLKILEVNNSFVCRRRWIRVVPDCCESQSLHTDGNVKRGACDRCVVRCRHKIPWTIQYFLSVLIETLPSKSASHYFVIEKLALPQLLILFLTMWIILFKRYVVQSKKYTTRISLIQISSERKFITSVFGFSHINCRNAEKELNLASGFEKYGPLKAIRQLSGCAPQG